MVQHIPTVQASLLVAYQRYRPPCTVSLVSLRTLAVILQNKAARAAKQAEAKRTTALRQLARAANAESVDKAQKQRLPPRSRAKINYLLWIEEDVFE
jgi:hypothetical protein